MKKEVGVSLLSADWSNIKKELVKLKTADHIHFDVMDGHFVPNFSYGLQLGMMVRKNTSLPIWSHLMITDPEKYIDTLAAFSQGIIIHQELEKYHLRGKRWLMSVLRKIKKKAKAGIALNPETPVQRVVPYLPLVDAVLVMDVHPGFGGQTFLKSVIPKFKYLRQQQSLLRKKRKRTFRIMVDGGINLQTNALVDADVVVAGSYVIKSKNPRKAIASLRG